MMEVEQGSMSTESEQLGDSWALFWRDFFIFKLKPTNDEELIYYSNCLQSIFNMFYLLIFFIFLIPMIKRISKEQIANVVSNLSASLQQLRIPSLNTLQTQDPIADLERMHSDILTLLSLKSSPHSTLQNHSNQNQALILECLKKFITVNQQLHLFSANLKEAQYPHSIYKSFSKLIEGINEASTILYETELADQRRQEQKQELINRNIEIYEQIVESAVSERVIQGGKQKNLRESAYEEEILDLRKEVDELNEVIRQNDEEYSIQIQRYNQTLLEFQETIREYQSKFERVRQYQFVINDLEHKLFRLKQQKCRDQLLIENMSKKLRIYEKERGGSEIFLSPRKQKIFSPSPRMKSPNMSGINYYGLKGRSFLGERGNG